jgi:hypothetical protein
MHRVREVFDLDDGKHCQRAPEASRRGGGGLGRISLRHRRLALEQRAGSAHARRSKPTVGVPNRHERRAVENQGAGRDPFPEIDGLRERREPRESVDESSHKATVPNPRHIELA